MTRPLAFLLVLLLAGCAASHRTMSSSGASAADVNPEVHRGMLTNQKSSPDSGQGEDGGRGGGVR
jgi:hypothetical protein